jgi:outer membrane protein TolC
MNLLTLKPLKTPARLDTETSVKGYPRNAMVDSAGTVRGLHPASSGGASWITAARASLLIAMLVIAAGVIGWGVPAQSADQAPKAVSPAPGTPLTYDEAVKIAITRSPYFTKSSLDIDIRRMDETDSRYDMAPPLSFTTTYYVNRPAHTGNSKPYSISFSTEPYNPLGAYFTLQAQKLVTQVAILTHLETISKGLRRVGEFYLQLDTLNKMAASQSELIQLSRENLTYAENRLSIGTGTSLEVKVARQQLELALGEQEGIELSKKRVLVGLKNFLGLSSTQDLTPDSRDSSRQVLGSFDPATASLDQAKERSYELKAVELHKQLQDYNISLAKSKVLPSFVFTTQTPSPLNYASNSGLYVGLGLQIPVWDGFKRIRNVSRQKAVLKQIGAQKTVKESFLEDKWFTSLSEIQENSVNLKNSRTLENLARLKAHQNEVRYQSGEAPLTVVLESRKEVLTIHKETLRRNLDYDRSVLQLRENSGDLGYSYVDANSWKK